MQATLRPVNDVSMPGHTGAQEVGEPASEVVTNRTPERLARAEPPKGLFGVEAITHPVEVLVSRVGRVKDIDIERFPVDLCATPVAMPPELNFGDRLVGLVMGEPVEGFGP